MFELYVAAMVVEGGILKYGTNTKNAVVSFPFLIELAMKIYYRMSHIGRNKLMKILQSNVWHPSLSEGVTNVCSTCDIYQKFKVSAQQVSPPVHRVRTQRPFQLVAADLF